MSVCSRCNNQIDDDSLYCAECGASVRASDNPAAGIADIENQLAAANLHRMRGEYAEATDRCTAILRVFPEDPDVHCLLGDIYADQNKVEEAMRWYQMAIEIDPDSRGCADKLEDLARKLADINATDGRASWFDRFVIGESFESSIRIITFTSAGFAALLIGFGLVALFTQKLPGTAGGSSTPTGQVEEYTRAGRPFVVGPTSPELDGQSAVRTSYEDHLLYQITSTKPVQARRIEVTGARLDPRTQSLTITYKNPSNSLDRSETLLNAGALAAVGFGLSDDIALVTVRCLAVTPEASQQNGVSLIFIADATKQPFDLLGPDATPEQISGALHRPWWGSVVK